ncbi:MAG: error-prone polymerase, partial [Thermoleophilaceae bacterium]|nr:error-prone polymerase [Thermoleophilaceae bacterium]
ELRASGLGSGRVDLVLRLVERLDGLPRHIALHPCGVLLSDATLLDRTPVESSWLGFPMSQFDKDDVEELGLLKLDVLGIRMQSAMQHAVAEVKRVDGVAVDVDGIARDDPRTFELIQATKTLGCFQIESPGQRELVGKFGPETFGDLITDISLFRPGPVKSDMVTPFLRARQGWAEPEYLHEDLRYALEETCGVVVFHEQVLQIVSTFSGCTLAEADEVRRTLGTPDGQPEVEVWLRPRAYARGYDVRTVDRVWEVLKAFASFGFCKAHAAAFALPTYQSAWLKTHHPAAFLAGVLTHDPGMYPKRLILDDARQFGIAVLALDVNRSEATYRVERVEAGYGIRLALSEVKGISEAEVSRIVAGRPYGSLSDFWHRAGVSRPVVERLVLTGAFDGLYALGSVVTGPSGRPGRLTRRDLLLQVGELDRWTRSVARGHRAGSRAARRGASVTGPAATREAQVVLAAASGESLTTVERPDVLALAARQSQAARPVVATPVQLALDLDDARLERHAQLGRGETDTRRRAHRVCQIVEQLVQVLAERIDGLALQPQPWIAQGDDGFYAHVGAEYRQDLEQALRVDVDRPRRTRVAAEDFHWPLSTQHDVEAPAPGASRDVGGQRPQHLDVRIGLLRPPAQVAGHGRRLLLRGRAILERDGQLDHVAERRRVEQAARGELRRVELARVFVTQRGNDRVVGQVRLHDRRAGTIATAGAPDRLREQLVRPLGGALVGQVQGNVRGHDANERHLGHVEPFGHESRAHEHVIFAVREGVDDARGLALALDDVAVETRGAQVRESDLDLALHALRAAAQVLDADRVARRAAPRHRRRRAAVMAAQRQRAGMEHERPLALRADLDVAAVAANDDGRAAAPIDHEDGLLRSLGVQRLERLCKSPRQEAPIARRKLGTKVDDLDFRPCACDARKREALDVAGDGAAVRDHVRRRASEDDR